VFMRDPISLPKEIAIRVATNKRSVMRRLYSRPLHSH
jgi:hypothetical protein